jgi:hypothetical protein
LAFSPIPQIRDDLSSPGLNYFGGLIWQCLHIPSRPTFLQIIRQILYKIPAN